MLLFFIPFYSVFIFLNHKKESLVNSIIVLIGTGLIIMTYPLMKFALQTMTRKFHCESKIKLLILLCFIIYCFSGFISYWGIIHFIGFNYSVE